MSQGFVDRLAVRPKKSREATFFILMVGLCVALGAALGTQDWRFVVFAAAVAVVLAAVVDYVNRRGRLLMLLAVPFVAALGLVAGATHPLDGPIRASGIVDAFHEAPSSPIVDLTTQRSTEKGLSVITQSFAVGSSQVLVKAPADAQVTVDVALSLGTVEVIELNAPGGAAYATLAEQVGTKPAVNRVFGNGTGIAKVDISGGVGQVRVLIDRTGPA